MNVERDENFAFDEFGPHAESLLPDDFAKTVVRLARNEARAGKQVRLMAISGAAACLVSLAVILVAPTDQYSIRDSGAPMSERSAWKINAASESLSTKDAAVSESDGMSTDDVSALLVQMAI